MKSLLLFSMLFGLSAPRLYAEGEVAPASHMVQVQVDFIELPQKNLTELLLGTTPSSDASELRGKVDGLLKSGVASVLESQVTTGNSGERQLIESVDEYIYPTE